MNRIKKKGKPHEKVRHDDGSEILNTLWPVKYCRKVGINLFSLTYKLFQGTKLSSGNNNNFVLDSANCKIALD